MKCVRNPITLQIKRLSEYEARQLVAYGWEYVSKGEYKQSLRPDYPAMRAKAAEIVGGAMAPKMRRV